ncbi:MAG: DUF1329 domain-containing protein [Rhodocyclaceae bacterium]|nr:DUF1329 domain-containing protein [Rhodocyclaceae bacterium]
MRGLNSSISILALGVACAMAAATSAAAVPEQEAAKLGKELTPVGAEKAGNKDGSIPEWKGGLPKGKHKLSEARPDPFAGDKPLFSIDASNVDKYKDKLSAGQVELIKTRKGYRMDVYPTRRSCGYPESVATQTRLNAVEAKLSTDGKDNLAQAVGGGFPFPIAKNGAEAVWNHRLRWQGEGRAEYYQTNFINPDGTFYGLAQDQWVITPFASAKAKSPEDVHGVQMKLLNVATAPASRDGEVILAHYFLNKSNDAWMYFPGQRRVRRLPAFEYDNPIPGYENLETADQYPMFAGALDRYDWKLVGKQEMYVPYNTFKFVAKRPVKEIYEGLFPKRDLMRYELHRVWKVEGTVKQGMRHMFAHRVFYLDEDTWMILAADQYDAQGKLWRVMEASLYPAVELGACVSQEFMSWDLTVNRYLAENSTQESKPTDWLAGAEGRVDPKRFEADELRRAGDR